ncbi:MAG: hypothetical protein AAFX79_02585 [Planctomycetota bacterium]
MVLVLAATAGTRAQSDLDPSIPAKLSLSGQDRTDVRGWADANWAILSGGDPVAASTARRRLVAPLLREDTTAAFRSALDQVLQDRLDAAMRGGDAFLGINSAIICGWIGTDRCLRTLLDVAERGDAAMRFAALSGTENAFRAGVIATPAFDATQARQAVDAVAAAIPNTTERSELDARIDALAQAMRVPEDRASGLSTHAAIELTRATGARMHTLPVDDQLGDRIQPLIKGLGAIQSGVTQRRGDVDPAWRREAMRLMGRCGALAFQLVRREQAGEISEPAAADARASIETALLVASTLPSLVRVDADVQQDLNRLQLLDRFRGTSDDGGDTFRRAIDDLMRIMGNEFGFPIGEFNLR